MRKIVIIAFIFITTISCSKKEYESFREEPALDKITRINLSPNSPVLIADGKAELKFKVKAYMEVSDRRTIEVKVNDQIVLKDSTFKSEIEIKEDRIPDEWIKIEMEDGTIVDKTFKTTKHAGETLKFKATIKGVESSVREVKIIEKPITNYEQIVVPVVFHIVYTKNTAYQYENMNTELLKKLIDRLNMVFAGELYPNAATTSNVNMKFELVTHNENNEPMKEIGIDRVLIGNSENTSEYCRDLVWDFNKYLNIWVHEGKDEWSVGVGGPQYILNNGSELIMGENTWEQLQKVDDISKLKWYSLVDIGIELNKLHVYRMLNATNSSTSGGTGDRLENIIGTFYGLVPTFVYNYTLNPWTDFCDDTYTYMMIFSRPEKWTYTKGVLPGEGKYYKDGNEIYYDSYNIMDLHSMSTTITHAQAERIRTAILNCPFRMMRK